MDSRSKTRKHRNRRIGIIIGLLVSAAAIVWILRTVEHQKVFEEVRDVRIFELILAVMFTILSYLLRSARWPYFFPDRPPGFRDSFTCLIIGFFMNNVLPARMGEIVRAIQGGKMTAHSKTTVLATIAGERLADGVALSIIFSVLFTLYATAADQEYSRALYAVAYLFAAASIGTVIVILLRHWIFAWLSRLDRLIPGKASSYTIERICRFIDGLEPMLRPRRLLIITIASFVIWFVELAAYGEICRAFNTEISIGGLSLFLAAVNFSSLIPSAPAGVGVIEAFATAALSHIGIAPETALAMVVAQHLIQFSVVGIPGSFLLIVKLHGRISLPEDESSEEDRPAPVNLVGGQHGRD